MSVPATLEGIAAALDELLAGKNTPPKNGMTFPEAKKYASENNYKLAIDSNASFITFTRATMFGDQFVSTVTLLD